MTPFTFDEYIKIFEAAKRFDYDVITVRSFFEGTYNKARKIIVNRVDVDVKINRVPKVLDAWSKTGAVGTFFLRLHAPNYNLLNIGNLQIARSILSSGCEVGLHTELEDIKGFLAVDPATVLREEVDLLESFLSTKIVGSASHGDMTAFNNLDFWRSHKAADFGLLYEAYDSQLWENCRYISDSEWTRWKAYDNGTLRPNDRRSPVEHMSEGLPVICLLTHPESWYDHYIHED